MTALINGTYNTPVYLEQAFRPLRKIEHIQNITKFEGKSKRKIKTKEIVYSSLNFSVVSFVLHVIPKAYYIDFKG